MKTLFNNRGEGHIKTAVIIIIAVVVGGLLIAGLYQLLGGNNGVLTKTNAKVNTLMDYNGDGDTVHFTSAPSGNRMALRYSYDGIRWHDCQLPTYSETTTVYGTITNNAEDNPVFVSLLKDGNHYYVLSSEDGGVSWTQKYDFTAKAITHCYYGDSSQIPGSFSGERFVIRFWTGGQTYYTMTTPTGLEWKAGWSDIIRS